MTSWCNEKQTPRNLAKRVPFMCYVDGSKYIAFFGLIIFVDYFSFRLILKSIPHYRMYLG
jgi:hypothetical protein